MTENINTPQKNTFDKDVDIALEMANSSARRMLASPAEQPRLERSDPQELLEANVGTNKPMRKIGAGVIGLALAAGTGAGISFVTNESAPKPSIEKTEVTVQDGQGLHEIIQKNSENAGSIDIRDGARSVMDDPANIHVFENGQLDPGEIVRIPVRFE